MFENIKKTHSWRTQCSGMKNENVCSFVPWMSIESSQVKYEQLIIFDITTRIMIAPMHFGKWQGRERI